MLKAPLLRLRKGDANETFNADRPCRLCICGNAGIFFVSHADCPCAFGN
jgi:hypothetical protein